MLEALNPPPKDKIIELMAQFRADPRDGKIDLGVGVYKDPEGRTPVMRAVRAAAHRVIEAETTKAYVGLAGDAAFNEAMTALVLGDALDPARTASVATPGGTGAIRIAAELIRNTAPDATVWLSDPTWPNHPAILSYLKIPQTSYRYFDATTGEVDFDAMMADLAGVQRGDVVLLHGCCHNPTGANLSPVQWQAVADLLLEKGATAWIDIAYQGFGDGLDADAYGTRLLARQLPELLIAASCSKNFGVYRERAGILMAISGKGADTGVVQGNLNSLNRVNYSFPPDHGARLVSTVLHSDDLRAEWAEELEAVRTSMLGLRTQLAEELRRLTNSDRYDFIARHRGMFSRLGLSPEAVAKLREEHGIYMVGDSRINIAGLNQHSVPVLARAIASLDG